MNSRKIHSVILGAFLAAYGVYLTIKYTQVNYKEDIRQRVLPFISLNTLRSKSYFNVFAHPLEIRDNDELKPVEGFYREYKRNEIYFVIEGGEVFVKTNLTKEQRDLLKQGGCRWISDSPNQFSFVDMDLVSIPLELYNVGNGAAINLRIGLNPIATEHKYITPLMLKVGDMLYIHIYSENQNENNI